ncbi:MAG: endonuclease III [Actinomycetaceae bacterium]|nr:endonuclease III [Actinomycetaceae bacterium]
MKRKYSGPAPVVDAARALAKAYPDAHCELNFTGPFELLVATVLSAQTTDARVNTVTPQLFNKFPTPAKMAVADVSELEDIVRPLGLFRRRAAALQKLAELLVENFGGQVPKTIKALTSLPGVGRKTANVVRGNCFGESAITVDVHVGRVVRRLGWSTNKDPLKVEKDLDALLETDWTQLCHELIWHGRRCCHSRNPECGRCPLLRYCPQIGVCEDDR